MDFNINVASTNEIWEFNPNAAAGSRWTQKVNAPEGIMYAPTCTINGIIYVGGASDFQGGTVVDTTNSFSFDPAANTIGTIAAIPRATGETRGLNFNGQMYVMGGGRVAPNPSNEVDIYDPGTNSWTTGDPFSNARRNFPTDTDGTSPHLAVRRLRDYWLPSSVDGDLLCSRANSHTNSITDRNAHGNAFSDTNSHADSNAFGDTISDANGDPISDRYAQSDAAAAADTLPSADTVVVS